jgi:hypothetical protein
VQRFVNWVKTRNLDTETFRGMLKKCVDHIDKCKLFLPYKKLYEEIVINVIFKFLVGASAICEKCRNVCETPPNPYLCRELK